MSLSRPSESHSSQIESSFRNKLAIALTALTLTSCEQPANHQKHLSEPGAMDASAAETISREKLREIADHNFVTWNAALQTHDAHKVAELYTKDSTFLPTVSPDFKKGPNGAEDYFHHFLEKNPYGTIVQDEIQELGNDSYLHSGMYNFEVGPENERQVVQARFSYVWKKGQDGTWKIIHHHSSAKPKPQN